MFLVEITKSRYRGRREGIRTSIKSCGGGVDEEDSLKDTLKEGL